MDANLLIGPMIQGPPTNKVGVLHPFESLLDVMLTAIGAHDLFIAPSVLVGEEEVFAKEGPLQVMPSALPNVIVEARVAAGSSNRHLDPVFHMTPGEDLL